MATPKLIDTDGLAVFKDECDKAYLEKGTLPDLTPYMKQTADSNLDMGTHILSVGNADIYENSDDLCIDASRLRNIRLLTADDIYLNKVPLATIWDVQNLIKQATYFTTDTHGNIVLRG